MFYEFLERFKISLFCIFTFSSVHFLRPKWQAPPMIMRANPRLPHHHRQVCCLWRLATTSSMIWSNGYAPTNSSSVVSDLVSFLLSLFLSTGVWVFEDHHFFGVLVSSVIFHQSQFLGSIHNNEGMWTWECCYIIQTCWLWWLYYYSQGTVASRSSIKRPKKS